MWLTNVDGVDIVLKSVSAAFDAVHLSGGRQ